MKYNVNHIIEEKSFDIIGLSYIGKPRSNTAVFITKKVEHLITALESVSECLVFAETGIAVPEQVNQRHAFKFSDRPQLDYAHFAALFAKEREEEESKISYIHHPNGYLISESAEIGENAIIEPGCVIGHGVKIGRNAKILYGAVICNAIIGDDFFCNEYAVVGSQGFTMVKDENDNNLRIPTLGRVIIGNNVEVGAHNNISCGSGNDTIIEDHVKLDAMVHVAHDDHLHRNVEVAAGTILGGFVEIGEKVFVGVNASVRNRINIGDEAYIGMGAAVMRTVGNGCKVAGNPAKTIPV